MTVFINDLVLAIGGLFRPGDDVGDSTVGSALKLRQRVERHPGHGVFSPINGRGKGSRAFEIDPSELWPPNADVAAEEVGGLNPVRADRCGGLEHPRQRQNWKNQ